MAALLRVLGASWRLSVEGRSPLHDPKLLEQVQVGALWHRDMLPATWLYRDTGVCVGVSRSQDGDWLSAVLSRLGYAPPARGSSSRGGAAALRELTRRCRDGTTVAITADGPRGPARRSKPGVIALASLAGTPITPVAFGARPAWRFRSWDGTLLPLPFARVICRFGDPIPVPRNLTPDERAALLEHLDRTLDRMTEEIDAKLRSPAQRLAE